MRDDQLYTTAASAARGCPTDEMLLAYLTAAVTADAAERIDAHLEFCDLCIESLIVAQQRLSQDAHMAETVPHSVRLRVAAIAPPRAARSAGDRVSASRLTRRPRRLPAIPPWRVVVPAALAASALLVVASQTWLTSSPRRPLTRAVPMSQQVRVTLPQAPVRTQPNLNADVIATLARGDVVEIGGEEREWYRVMLPSGGEGWVERRAFR